VKLPAGPPQRVRNARRDSPTQQRVMESSNAGLKAGRTLFNLEPETTKVHCYCREFVAVHEQEPIGCEQLDQTAVVVGPDGAGHTEVVEVAGLLGRIDLGQLRT
jgi:hypothetical protein